MTYACGDIIASELRREVALDEQIAQLESSFAHATDEERSRLLVTKQEMVRQRREVSGDDWWQTVRKHTHLTEPMAQA